MSRFSDIRALLGMTQQEMAQVLGCVQSNVSFLDRGQTITAEVAAKLISAARVMGIALTFDHVYGASPLPLPSHRSTLAGPPPLEWAVLLSDLALRGWSLIDIAVRIGVRLSTVRSLALGEVTDPPHAVGEALIRLHESGEKPAAKLAKAGEVA